VKKAEERMTQLTAEIARIDDDMANASISNPKALEGLTRARDEDPVRPRRRRGRLGRRRGSPG
jgi:hypothetical protein